MLYVTDECKEAFLSAQQKILVLSFDDGTVIDNDDIAMESMGLEQYLCSTDELRFGEISSAKFTTKIKVSTKRYKDLWFNATLSAGDYSLKLGRFKVYTDNMTSDELYREIVAYDALHEAMNANVTDWFNGLTFPITQKTFRDSLFVHLGIEQEEIELPNDEIEFLRTVSAENISGLTVLQNLCEINATWGVINNDGKFKYAKMRTHEHDALYPSDELYPSENVFPNDIYDERLSKANYFQGTLKYQEYETQPITKVTIREDSEDLGYSYGADGNEYIIQNNFLLYGASDETLDTVAKNFYSNAKYIAYTPSELKCKGAPWREVGDLLKIVADKKTLTLPILNRRLEGITALKDVYAAKGKEVYVQNANSPIEELKQLKSRTNKLTRNLDETISEVSKINADLKEKYPTKTEMNSAIKQSADSINLSVEKTVAIAKTDGKNYLLNSRDEKTSGLYNSYKLSSQKEQLNGQPVVVSFEAKTNGSIKKMYIDANIGTIADTSISMTSEYQKFEIKINAIDNWNDINLIMLRPSPYVEFSSKNVKLEVGEVATEWSYAPEEIPEKFSEYSTTEEMRSEIRQTADEINIEVSKKVDSDEVVTSINLSEDTLELKGNRVVIQSDKFVLDSDGGATFSSNSEVWILPTAYDVDRIRKITLGQETVSGNLFKAMDFNCDGKINIIDFIAAKAILLGKESIEHYVTTFGYQKQYSTVLLEIDSDNAEKTIKISGTNSFGSYVESYLGLNVNKVDQIRAEGANIGKIYCGEISTSSGNDLDSIATRLATVESRLGITS